MSKVFVVGGATGEYDDRSEWPVHAFKKQEIAEKFRDRLNDWCKAHGCEDGSESAANFYFTYAHDYRPPEDPHFRCTHTGVSYNVFEIPFTG